MKPFRMLILLSALINVLMSSTPLLADEAVRVRGTFGAGLTFGGDTLGTLLYNNGDTSDLKAGGLFHFYGGMILEKPRSPFMMKFAFGWHFDQVSAINSSATFDRYPLDIIPYFRSNNIRMGAGLTYHMSPKADSSDFVNGSVVNFKNAAGLAVELGINLGYSDMHWLDFRFVSIDYKYDDIATTETVNGSHVGVYYSAMF